MQNYYGSEYSESEDGVEVKTGKPNMKDDINKVIENQRDIIYQEIDENTRIFSDDKLLAKDAAITAFMKKYRTQIVKDIKAINKEIIGLRKLGYIPAVLKETRDRRILQLRQEFDSKVNGMRMIYIRFLNIPVWCRISIIMAASKSSNILFFYILQLT